MTKKQPTASVRGRQEWQWNRWQAQQQSDGPSSRMSCHQQSRSFTCDRRDRKTDKQRRIEQLEAQLERKERRHGIVIEQYERRLNEKNRQLAARDRSETRSDSILSKIVRLLRDR